MNQMSLNVMATLVSSKKRKSGSGINYHRLSGDEDNNNRSLNNVTNNNNNNKSVTVATATSTINKSRSQYSQHQSIDDPDDQHSINDFDSDSDDEDRLTCWVCERSFSSARILRRHKIHQRHFGCGTCEAIFRNQMALESHQEAHGHWSDDDDDDDDGESVEEFSDDSALDSDDEIEIERKANDPLKKERVFLL